MKPIVVKAKINADCETVFASLTDLERMPEVISAITKTEVLTDGPVGIGTRFRETRVMFGREAKEEMEFTEFDPPNQYVLAAESNGARYRTVHSLKPVDGGTEVSLEFGATPVSFLAKIMSPLMGIMMKGMLTRCLEEDLADIKKSIESSAS